MTDITPIPNTGNDYVHTPATGAYSADLGPGNDIFYAGLTNQVTVIGGTGDDLINLYGPSLSGEISGLVDGNEGNDTFNAQRVTGLQIYGNRGNDQIFLQTATATQIFGGQGDDYIQEKNVGASTIYGNMGNDRIDASGTSSTIFGGQGEDSINLVGGNNVAYGNLGNDDLFINGGNGTLYGGHGDDLLQTIDPINAKLTGGLGNDTFAIGFGGGKAGAVEITDYRQNDLLELVNGPNEPPSFADVGNNLVLTFRGTTMQPSTLTLDGLGNQGINSLASLGEHGYHWTFA